MDTTSERAHSPTNVNDLFDYDVGLDEIFQDKPTATANANANANANASKPATGDPTSLGLGLDEEVKVTKKRQPIPKLDEARLLSQPGIPKLRRTAKTKLRFKGKGYEFQDAERLLNFYQLWLDDLYPRAKFADGLTIIEKLGHTKRMQTMRKEWIDEEKPRYNDPIDISTTRPSDQHGANASEPQASSGSRSRQIGSDAADQDLFMPDPEAETRPPVSHPEPDDDELEDLLREQDEIMPNSETRTKPPVSHTEPDGDDLDDLLREQDEVMSGMPEPASKAPNDDVDDFDAEYEAMNELGL